MPWPGWEEEAEEESGVDGYLTLTVTLTLTLTLTLILNLTLIGVEGCLTAAQKETLKALATIVACCLAGTLFFHYNTEEGMRYKAGGSKVTCGVRLRVRDLPTPALTLKQVGH